MKMTKFPMSIANGFVPDQIVGLEGHCEGTLDIHGSTKHPDVDGELFVEDAYLISHPYGVKMRFDNDPVRIVDSRILIENFGLYSYNDEPLVLMGSVNFSNTDRIMMDMRMRAQNFQLINAKQTAKSIAYGKAFVNFFARMQGPIDELNIRGRLDVLGSTDMTYLLLDSPLSTDNRLDELVKFTDFSDTTEVVVTRPMPTGLVADLNINVSEGAHIVCGLNQEQTNYVDLTGGGDLRMKYNSEGIDLKGRYTINSGVMKYSLPIIPLRTFNIKNGSYVEFTGDPMNPRLSITATERNKSTVKDESGAVRSVVFNCGVEISKTLNDMGLQFIIEAPEDNLINGELSAMSIEERGKIAVAMITTGMYLDSNSSGRIHPAANSLDSSSGRIRPAPSDPDSRRFSGKEDSRNTAAAGKTASAEASRTSGFSVPTEQELGEISVHRENNAGNKGAGTGQKAAMRKGNNYVPPPFSLLDKGERRRNDETERELKETAHRLQETLRTFGVQVTVTDISQGPTVTRYELRPDKGVKVSKIINLSDDIKLRLAATDIRIEAPIPGKSAIGIEVPNKTETTVHLRDLLESQDFRRYDGRLPFAVGKDLGGRTVISVSTRSYSAFSTGHPRTRSACC